MRKISRAKWLAMVMVPIMLLSMAPVVGAVDPPAGGEVVGNFAFVPNSGEASVSKVNLDPDAPPVEVARYSTIEPRPGDYALDKYRVSRLAIDSGGNAWALNTMTGQSFPDYAVAQGSVARINAEPVDGEDPGVTTSNSSAIVTDDVRVSYFDLGEPGDGPRTINIVEEGDEVYLWIGFYLGNYFQKYWWDAENADLVPVEDAMIELGTYTPYYAALDADGIMWVSSRNASPFPSPVGTPGVLRFDTGDLDEFEVLEYSFTGQNNPYAIIVASDGRVWVSDGGDWGNTRERFFAVYSGDGTVEYVSVGTGSQAMRGFIEYEGAVWATAINGRVLKGTFDGTVWTWEAVLTGLGELTGIGPDAFGYLWAVRLGSNDIYRFDPEAPAVDPLMVGVGMQPYAYDNFIQVAPPTYEFCGYKYLGDTDEGLEGWEIKLYKDVDGVWVDQEKSAFTDEYGKYCFSGLAAGTYKVSEVEKSGWMQTYPAGNEHIVVLPAPDPVEAPYGGFQIVDSEQGLRYDYTAVRAQRSNPDAALTFTTGQNEANFFSLGFQEDRPAYLPADDAWVIIEFDPPILNGPGDDVRVIEDTWGLPYPDETADVWVSNDAITWHYLGEADNQTPFMSYHTITDFDLDVVGLDYAKFVKVQDTSVRADFAHLAATQGQTLDGFDLNAVVALNDYEPTYDFRNVPALECFDETAMAAQDEPGQYRFVDKGNWFTYITYDMGDGTLDEPATYPLYAGQTNLVGELWVYDADGKVYVKYLIDDEAGEGYKDGYCGSWAGITEYHLQVVDEFDGFNPYRTYNKRTGYGSIIPGQLTDKGYFDEKTAETDWIMATTGELSETVYIAAHSVAWWCGYECENGAAEAASTLGWLD